MGFQRLQDGQNLVSVKFKTTDGGTLEDNAQIGIPQPRIV